MSARQPLVSVIMPAYNAQETIGAAITGVLTQDYPRVELIVVDDGSTDRTQEICAAYGDLIRYRRVTNGGTASARNAGLLEATGDFLALCDSDDVLLPPYVATSLRAYQEAGGGRKLVMNDAVLLTAAGIGHGRRMVGRRFNQRADQRLGMLQKNMVSIFTFFPRRLLEEVGVFDAHLRYREDWELWLRAVLSGWQIVYQPQAHALYRWSPSAKSTHPAGYDVETEILRGVLDRHGPQLSAAERAFLERRLQTKAPRLLDLEGQQALRSGDIGAARDIYATLATLSSQDPQTLVKSSTIARIPGAARLWRARLLRIDARIGRTSEEVLR
ncbi:MAG: glycosyltransferase family 2 protein [Austwickia sp.]|nr:glycosyltransferase family 2 protein [Actinomycetota bacterium]MCB1253264.1 glycosyltransferase family 2 protein [Austwickia sp.]